MNTEKELAYEAERVIALHKQMNNTFNEKNDEKVSQSFLKLAIMAGIKGAYNKGLDNMIMHIKAFHLDSVQGNYSKDLLDWCNKWIEDNLINEQK